jgi:hypothetical protein
VPTEPNPPLHDPTNNFTVPQTQPAGLRIPEFAIRQLIGWMLGRVRGQINTPGDVLDQLFAVVPAEVRSEFKGWLLRNENIYVDVSFPREAAWLAMVVVEPQSEAEDTEHAFLGDLVGTTDRGQLGGQVPTEALAYGIPETRTTNIYVASDDDRLTLLLYTLVKYFLVYNKANLTKFYDVHNLVLSGGVLDHDSDKLPQFVYYRVLQARYMTIFDYNGPASGPVASVDLVLNVAEFVGGVETDTQVEPPVG